MHQQWQRNLMITIISQQAPQHLLQNSTRRQESVGSWAPVQQWWTTSWRLWMKSITLQRKPDWLWLLQRRLLWRIDISSQVFSCSLFGRVFHSAEYESWAPDVGLGSGWSLSLPLLVKLMSALWFRIPRLRLQLSDVTTWYLVRIYFLRSNALLSLVARVLMKRCFVTGATWVSDTFAKVQHAAAEVNQEANEKAAVMEAEEYRTGHRSGHNRVFSGEDNRSPHADNSSAPTYPPSEHAPVADAGSESTVQYPNLGYDHYMPLLSSELPATKPPTAQA